MNTTDVLSLMKADALQDIGTGKKATPQEDLLFALLFNNLLGVNLTAKEQFAEGCESEPQVGLLQANIPQHIIPAGKEANSGANGIQQLSQTNQQFINLSLASRLVLDNQNLSPANIDQKRSTGTILKESPSLNLLELDKHITITRLLNNMSAQITSNDKPTNQPETLLTGFSKQNVAIGVAAINEKALGLGPSINGEHPIASKQLSYNPQSSYNLQSSHTSQPNLNHQSNLDQQSNLNQQSNQQAFVLTQERLNQPEGRAVNTDHQTKSTIQSQTLPDQPLSRIELMALGERGITAAEIPAATAHNAGELISARIWDQATPAKVWDQVMAFLHKQEFSKVQELSIQLHPAELGKVNFSVRLESGQVHLLINATENTTLHFLQNNLNELKAALAQNGIDCGSLELGSQPNSHNSQDQQNRHQEKSAATYFEEESHPYPQNTAPLGLHGAGTRINLKA